MMKEKRFGGLSGSTLKLIACVAMFFDHFGYMIFPAAMIYRAIGRLAFPIFAYFIAEGCKYTRNKLKHFLLIFSVGMIYFFFYLIAFGSAYPSIFLTFSVSILNIYLIDYLKCYAFLPITENTSASGVLGVSYTDGAEFSYTPPRVKPYRVAIAILVMALSLLVSAIPFSLVKFDYGYLGMLGPVLISLVDFSKIKVPEKLRFLDTVPTRLLLLATVCIGVAVKNPALKVQLFGLVFTVQVFNLLALPLLALYNGKVGTKRLKYFFYAFYPVHLGVIMVIEILIQVFTR